MILSAEGSEDTGLLGVVGRTGDFVLFVLVFFVPLVFTLVFTSFVFWKAIQEGLI